MLLGVSERAKRAKIEKEPPAILGPACKIGLVIYMLVKVKFFVTMPIILIISLVALPIAHGMYAEEMQVSVNGRELTRKERKRCCTRAFIWTSIILLNILIGATIYVRWD